MNKPIDALKTIARYVEAKKPKTLAEAEARQPRDALGNRGLAEEV